MSESANERLYHWFFQHSMEATFLTDVSGKIFAANPAACALLGRSERQICEVGRAGVVDNTSPELGRFLEERERTGRARADLFLLRADGSRFPAEVSSAEFIDDDGVARTVVIARDQTLQKQAEKALRLSEARFRQLIDKAPVAIGLGRDAKLIYVNQKFLELYGFETDNEVLGQPIGNQWAPQSQAKIEDQNRKRVEGKSAPLSFEDIGQRKDGSTFHCRAELSVIDLPDGPAAIAFLTDITESKRAQEQLHVAQKMESLGLLTAGVAHDFRNILAALLANLEEAAHDIGNAPKIAQHITSATKIARQGVSLTQRLLDFGRKKHLTPKRKDIREAVYQSVDLLKHVLPKNIFVEIVCDPERKNWTNVDDTLLESALLNLGMNAVDAMPEGGSLLYSIGQIEGSASPFLTPGQYIEIKVQDTGIGMPADVKLKVFDPFFTTKPIGKGTGLGLSMVYDFVRQSGGHIEVSSIEGKGTTFTIFLPLVRTESEDLGREISVRSPKINVSQSRKVLLVEDLDELRDVILIQLERLNCVATAVADATAALEEMSKESTYEVLITDLGLPGEMQGDELANLVDQEIPGIKIITMSGYDDARAVRRVAKSLTSSHRHLKKPFTQIELREALDGLFASP